MNQPQLPRVLGLWMAMALVVGTVIGAGVFKKPAVIAQNIDYFGLILAAWILVGIITLFGALSIAEVAILVPRAGGNYVYLRESYGRWAGFLWGWVEFWIIRSASIAALATVFTESLHDLLRFAYEAGPREQIVSFWGRQAITLGVILILTQLNAMGARLGGGLQVFITGVKVFTLLAIAAAPLLVFLIASDSGLMSTNNLQPFWPDDWSKVDWSKFGAALLGVLWAYHGWMNLAPAAEEITEPQRNIPLAFLLGTLAVMGLYVTVNVAYHLVIPHGEILKMTDRPVANDFAARLIGPFGLLLASAAVMISVFGALNGNLLVGPRLLYAMGLDRLAPRSFSTLHPRYRTPFLAHWVLTGWTVLLVLIVAEFGDPTKTFDLLTDYAIFGALTFETLAVASIFVLRKQYPPGKVDVPYRCWLYPYLTIVYILVLGAVLVNMFWTQPIQSFAALGFIGAGVAVYVAFLRPPSMMHDLIDEFQKHKNLADRALAQLTDDAFFQKPGDKVNAVAAIVKHLAGNLTSRWTEFLTTDGEKPTRNRDGEFIVGAVDSRANLLEQWERGWAILFASLQTLTGSDLTKTVTIRGEVLTARQACLRGLTHAAYHVGQILYVARLVNPQASYVTIPPRS